jgi:hypothetical protein
MLLVGASTTSLLNAPNAADKTGFAAKPNGRRRGKGHAASI